MKKVLLLVIFALALMHHPSGAQMIVKEGNNEYFRVDKTTGNVMVSHKLSTTDLQVSGGTPAAGRILISDATGNASWGLLSGGSGILIGSDNTISAIDISASNETPQAGDGISIAGGRQVNVLFDGSTIKLNQANELYADISVTESDPVWTANDNDHSSSNELPLSGNGINIAADGRTLSAKAGNGITVNSTGINAVDVSATNETPLAGDGITVNGRTVSVVAPTTDDGVGEKLLWSGSAFLSQQMASSRAYMTGETTIGYNSWEKIIYQNVDYDVTSSFNTTHSRFTNNLNRSAEFYVRAGASFTDVDNLNAAIAIWKNGAFHINGTYFKGGTGTNRLTNTMVSGIVRLDPGDYIEIYGFQRNPESSSATIWENPAFPNSTTLFIVRELP